MMEQASISLLFRFVFQGIVGFVLVVKKSSRLVLPLTGKSTGKVNNHQSLYVEECSHTLDYSGEAH